MVAIIPFGERCITVWASTGIRLRSLPRRCKSLRETRQFPRLHLEILAICNPHAHAAFEHEVIGDDLRSTTHNGPTPVEFLLQAIAVCLTAGIGNIASARGVELTSVEAFVEGDIDLLGILSVSDQFRNGYNAIRVNFAIEGNAPKEKLRQIVEQSAARSAVFDVLTNGTAVTVTVNGN